MVKQQPFGSLQSGSLYPSHHLLRQGHKRQEKLRKGSEPTENKYTYLKTLRGSALLLSLDKNQITMGRFTFITTTLVGCLLSAEMATAQTEVPPYVFSKEKTSVAEVQPTPFKSLKPIRELPSPLLSRVSGQPVNSIYEWENRREEIISDLEEYEIGEKPSVAPENIQAMMSGDTLKVEVTVNGQHLLLTSTIH